MFFLNDSSIYPYDGTLYRYQQSYLWRQFYDIGTCLWYDIDGKNRL